MLSSNARRLCGILNVNKPAGITSRDVVNAVARTCEGVKAGHAGTLDPIATGVLVVCLGQATRLIEYVQRMPKTYRTLLRLGVTSDTLDIEGNVVPSESAVPVDIEKVRAAVAAQVGQIEQVPPQFSALKVAGRRAYELARAGRTASLQARPVNVYQIDLVRYEWPLLEAVIECGSGTYIRSIARDVGEQLGCGGIVERLTRTRIGHFTLQDAISLEEITGAALPSLLRPALEAVSSLPKVRLESGEVRAILQGQTVVIKHPADDLSPGDEVAMLDREGEFLGLAVYDPPTARLSPKRILAAGPRPDLEAQGPRPENTESEDFPS